MLYFGGSYSFPDRLCHSSTDGYSTIDHRDKERNKYKANENMGDASEKEPLKVSQVLKVYLSDISDPLLLPSLTQIMVRSVTGVHFQIPWNFRHGMDECFLLYSMYHLNYLWLVQQVFSDCHKGPNLMGQCKCRICHHGHSY